MSGRTGLRLAVLVAAMGARDAAGPPALGAASADQPCPGVAPPSRLTTAPAGLPASFVSARVGGVVVDEALIGADGAVSQVRPIRARFAELAPFGQKSVQDSRFSGGAVEGHPAAMRVRVSTTVGTVTRTYVEPEYDSVWAYAAGGQSREAVWQLAGSVEKLTIEAHLGTAATTGAEVVARAPDGKERVLRKIPPSPKPVDLRETVAMGKFLATAGDYRIELRASGKTLASTTLTIADDFTRAVINTCEPL